MSTLEEELEEDMKKDMGVIAYTHLFLIRNEHANDLAPLVFGGALFGEMDLTAAMLCRMYLANDSVNKAVTHKADVTYHAPSYVGDLLSIRAKVVSAHKKSIVVAVKVVRVQPIRTVALIAEAKFVFVSIEASDLTRKPDILPYRDHTRPMEPKTGN